MMPRKLETAPNYSVHPSVKMIQSWIASLSEKTGKSLEEWIRLAKKSGPKDEAARAEWLKQEHGLGTNAAWWISGYVEGRGLEDRDPDAYLEAAAQWVDAMFTGPKENLLPLYNRLLRLGQKLGKDVRICPCRTIVPMYRKHVFAEIKPSTRTRIDLGLALKDFRGGGRLIETGGLAKGDRITHRVPLTSIDEVDDEVKTWLKMAYDLDK